MGRTARTAAMETWVAGLSRKVRAHWLVALVNNYMMRLDAGSMAFVVPVVGTHVFTQPLHFKNLRRSVGAVHRHVKFL